MQHERRGGPLVGCSQYAPRMRWEVEWLVDRSEEPASIPAYKFLKALPVNVRIQLLAILDAVKTTGPDQWADRHSHCPMKGDLADLHEVRDKQSFVGADCGSRDREADSRCPRTAGDARRRFGGSLRRRDQGSHSAGQAQRKALPGRLHVPAFRLGVQQLEITICDLKWRPRRSAQAPAGLYRARDRNAFRRSAE